MGLGPRAKPGSPTGHSVSLGEGTEHNDVLFGLDKGTAGDGSAGILQVHVAFIEQQEDSPRVGQLHDAFQVLGRDDGAGRVRGRVEDDGLGPRGDRALDGIRSNAEVFRFFGGQEHDLAARIPNDVLERDPVGDGQNHLIAMVHQHLDGIKERQLAAGGENGFVRGVIGAEVAGVALHDRLSVARGCRRPPCSG